MAGRIPQSFIDDLIIRVDIVDVIDERVPLKKAGHEYKACCPFHNEKTPSFTVSQKKQFYHCFGCGAHGTVIGFLMDYAHLDFIEAVEELAGRAGLSVPRSESSARPAQPHAELYALLGRVAEYYQRALREHPAAARARRYLEQRGLDSDVIEVYGIGYAPPGWDNLQGALGGDESLRRQLVATGMLVERDDKRYDRFRDRIQFPIHDRRGRIIGFGGRALDEETPKYLNSPETPLFHKGRELYGLYQSRRALRSIPRLMVVEGYMDVVALAQYGIRYAVAALGTAATRDHLEVLFRIAPEIVFCFDGDRAGRQAAWRALENALPVMVEGRQIGFMFLPEGEDPDSLVRQEGAERFEQRVVNAVPFSRTLYDKLADQVNTDSVDGRARLVELARPLLVQIPQGVYRDMMIRQLAQTVDMPVEQLTRHLQAPGTPLKPSFKQSVTKDGRRGPSPLRLAIALLLHHPSLAQDAGNPRRFEGLDMAGIPLLIELIEVLQDCPHLTTGAMLERWRDTDTGRHLAKLARWCPPVPDDGLETEFLDTLRHLERLIVDQRFEQLLSKPLDELNEQEKDELKQLHATLTGARK